MNLEPIRLNFGAYYQFWCIGPDGRLKWYDGFKNVVPNLGGADALDKYLAGVTYTAAWYMGLKGTGTPQLTDTLASHATWSEVNPYTGNRPAVTWNAASGKSKASQTVAFSITAAGPTTVAGGFLCTVNTGTSGLLFSAGDFTQGNKSVTTGDTINAVVTVTC